MPIPTEKEERKDIETLKKELGMPDDWKLKYSVEPYLGMDFVYEIDKEKKIIKITVYSARYPSTFTNWYKAACAEIRKKMGWKIKTEPTTNTALVYDGFIPRSDETEGLYRAEASASEWLYEAAKKFAGLIEKNKPEDAEYSRDTLWNIAVPSELYNMLESYQSSASIAAAKKYLEKQGYTVEKI